MSRTNCFIGTGASGLLHCTSSLAWFIIQRLTYNHLIDNQRVRKSMHITSLDRLRFTSRYKYKHYYKFGPKIFHVDAFQTENKNAFNV